MFFFDLVSEVVTGAGGSGGGVRGAWERDMAAIDPPIMLPGLGPEPTLGPVEIKGLAMTTGLVVADLPGFGPAIFAG